VGAEIEDLVRDEMSDVSVELLLAVPRSSLSISLWTKRAMPPVANSESTTFTPSIWALSHGRTCEGAAEPTAQVDG